MNMASTQLEATAVIRIFNWIESTSTTTRPAAANMCREPFWWIWNREQWTPFDLDLLARSLDQITLYLVSE